METKGLLREFIKKIVIKVAKKFQVKSVYMGKTFYGIAIKHKSGPGGGYKETIYVYLRLIEDGYRTLPIPGLYTLKNLVS